MIRKENGVDKPGETAYTEEELYKNDNSVEKNKYHSAKAHRKLPGDERRVESRLGIHL